MLSGNNLISPNLSFNSLYSTFMVSHNIGTARRDECRNVRGIQDTFKCFFLFFRNTLFEYAQHFFCYIIGFELSGSDSV